jgi:hypothetical protein
VLCWGSGESPRRRAVYRSAVANLKLAVNLKTGKLGLTELLSTSRESAMAREKMPGRNHQAPSKPKPAAGLKVLCPHMLPRLRPSLAPSRLQCDTIEGDHLCE